MFEKHSKSFGFFGFQYLDFFTFSFVRNPYDRLYSSYKFLQTGGMNEHDKVAFQKYLSKFSDFEDFVLNGLNNEIIYEIIHFVPQSEFICNKNGEILVDFVGRFENLNDDLNSISRKIKKELALEHHNKNFKKDYKKIYNQEMKTKVYEVYKKDFVLFNYNFLNNDAWWLDGFTNMDETFLELKELMTGDTKLKKNKIASLYNLGLGFVLVYILFCLMKKNH